MPQYRIRPSRISSIIGVVVGIGMLIFFLSKMGEPKVGNPMEQDSSFRGFAILFVLALLCIIGYHFFNAFTSKGVAHEVIDLDDNDDDDRENAWPGSDSRRIGEERGMASEADRLRKLEELREQGLISTDEYDQKRREILDEI